MQYFYLISNKEEIKRNTYEDDPIERNTEFFWFPVNVDNPTVNPIRISENTLELDDTIMGLKSHAVKYFELKQMPRFPQYYNDKLISSIREEMDMSHKIT